MANPRRKKSRNRRARNSAFPRHRRSRRAKNPFSMRRRHSRSRNPIGMGSSDILKLGLGAFGGAIGSGYLTQMLLNTSNAGFMGYAGDAVATLVLAWAANKFSGPKVAEGVIAGGFGALIKRVWQEQVSGNVSMSGLGNGDYLGYYSARNYALPTTTAGGSYALAAPAGTPIAAPSAAQAGAVASGAATTGRAFKSPYSR